MTSALLSLEADSQHFAPALLGAMAASLNISTPQQFLTWTAGELQSIFPHGSLVAGLVDIDHRSAKVRKLLSRNFPSTLLNAAISSDGTLRCAIFSKWTRDSAPQLMDASQATEGNASDWVGAFQQTGLDNIAAYGIRDAAGVISYFSFSRIPGSLGEHHAQVLKLIAPHMHLALLRALAKARRLVSSRKAKASLSPRQLEVLNCLKLGKSNPEIAQRLGVSPFTVKHTVSAVLDKLHVTTRTRAVIRAQQLRLI
jgi:LuxR family transcriptional regulator, quorum-sensing system regulator CviR